MFTLTVYMKDHKRMPIRSGSLFPFRDTQADLPWGWCAHCGRELFQFGQEQCFHCRNAKGEFINAT